MGRPGDDDTTPRDDAAGNEPTRELPSVPAGGSGDRCGACGAPLIHDQRYCVECGERRGQSRFPVTQPATEVATRRVRRVSPPRPPRIGSGTTLVAGVGVLLLAIGLGFLIGRTSTKTTTTQAAAATPQVITVQGGVGAAAPTTTTTAAKLSKKSKAKAKAAAAAAPSAAVQKKATEAAGKVLGNSNNLPPPTSTVGQKCDSTKAGCSGGKFSGNFFGP